MLVTLPTSHAATGWLKMVAEQNIDCAARAHALRVSPLQPQHGQRHTRMVVTFPTSHAATGWLKSCEW